MNKFKINNAKTFLPLNVAKGTVEQRMQKARLMNLKFFDNLQDSIRMKEITPAAFSRTLRKTAGAPIKIDIIQSQEYSPTALMYNYNQNGIANGFVLSLPHTFYTDKIHQNSALKFLKITQDFFNETFNPKIFTRFNTLLNKKYDLKSIFSFYSENVSSKNTLSKSALDKMLDGKKIEEKINILQFFRYKLLSEKNTTEAARNIEKRVERHNNLTYERPEGYFDIAKYQFDEKFKILNEKLSEVISLGRKK